MATMAQTDTENAGRVRRQSFRLPLAVISYLQAIPLTLMLIGYTIAWAWWWLGRR